MPAIDSKTRGYLLVVITATFWGLSGALAKFLMAGPVDPITLTWGRSLITAIALAGYLALREPSAFRLSQQNVVWVLLFGIALAGTQVMFFSAIARLNVATAILLEYLAPALIVLYSWVVQGRSITRVTLASLVAVLVGAALVVRAYDPVILRLSVAGVLFGCGAAVAFSVYILTGEHLQRLNMSVATQLFFGFTITMVMLSVLRPPWTIDPGAFEPRNLALIGFIGLAGTLLPFATFFASLRYIDAARATITSTLEPVVAGLIAFAWLGEVFTLAQTLGAALVIGAIIALQRERPPDEVVVPPEVIGFVDTEALEP